MVKLTREDACETLEVEVRCAVLLVLAANTAPGHVVSSTKHCYSRVVGCGCGRPQEGIQAHGPKVVSARHNGSAVVLVR